MPVQTTTSEELSTAETDALARYVHDMRTRMTSVVQLLQDRGSARASELADSIADRLAALEEQLASGSDQPY